MEEIWQMSQASLGKPVEKRQVWKIILDFLHKAALWTSNLKAKEMQRKFENLFTSSKN